MISFKQFLNRAETKAFAVVALLGGVLKLPLLVAVFGAVWSTAGQLFAVVSLAAFALAPKVSFLPETPLVVVSLLVGSIVLIKRGRKWLRSFLGRIRSST